MALRLFTSYRWAITGTPVGRHGIEDVFGPCLFTQQFPLAHRPVFDDLVRKAEHLGPNHWKRTEASGVGALDKLAP